METSNPNSCWDVLDDPGLKENLIDLAKNNFFSNPELVARFVKLLAEDCFVLALPIEPITKQKAKLKAVLANAERLKNGLEHFVRDSSKPPEKFGCLNARQEFFAVPCSASHRSNRLDHLDEKWIQRFLSDLDEVINRSQIASDNLDQKKWPKGKQEGFAYKLFLVKMLECWIYYHGKEPTLEHNRAQDLYSGQYFEFIKDLHNLLEVKFESDSALGRNIQYSKEWRKEPRFADIQYSYREK